MQEIEYRLYYDDFGKVLYYSCEDTPGNYIVVDALTYAEGRYDCKIVDGEITKVNNVNTIFKLVLSTDGTKCPVEDISIIADTEYTGKINYWNTKHV